MFHRRKGRKDRSKKRSSPAEPAEGDAEGEEEVSQSSPIDAKFLEEEGRVVTGKLVNFAVPEGFELKWFVNTDEQSIFEQHRAGADIASLLDWKHELQEEDVGEFGFFGFDNELVRMHIEALQNTQNLKGYKFVHEDDALGEIMQDIEQQMNNAKKTGTTADRFHELLLQKRWQHDLERVFPAAPTPVDASEEEMLVRLPQWGFKMLVSKAFPAGGVEVLLSLWDLMDSSRRRGRSSATRTTPFWR